MFQGPEIIIYWYDCAILIAMLTLSISIGIYFGIFGRKQSTSEYLMGNRRMKPLPVSCSAISSFISSLSLVGIPSDVYLYGGGMLLMVIIMTLECIIACTVFLPVLVKLRVTSIFEYLTQRFDERTRKFIALLYIFFGLMRLPCVIYLTVIILSPAVGISIHSLVPLISGICIFYTTVGGFKTVIWTDTIQFVFILASLVSVLTLGITSSGQDLKTIWNKAIEGERLNIFDFDFNPTKRDTFWALIIGLTVHYISLSSMSQDHMQKIMSVQTFRESVIAEIYFAIGITIMNTLCALTGILIYVKYSDCDPVLSKRILANDQLLLLYVTDVTQNIPGLTGIFLVGVVSAALSTQSASLNSLASVIHEDFIKELMDRNMSEKRKHIILRVIVLTLGIATTLPIFIIIQLNTSIFSCFLSLTGIVTGTTLGVFTLGIIFPIANAKGALYGSICGFLSTAFIVIPAIYYQFNGFWNYQRKPLSTDNCTFENDTDMFEARNKTGLGLTQFQPPAIFRISLYYYTIFGLIVTVVSGLVISYSTKDKNDPSIDKSLLSPFTNYFVSKKDNTAHKNVTYNSIEGSFIDNDVMSSRIDDEVCSLK